MNRTVRFYFGWAVDVAALVDRLLDLKMIGGATITTGRGYWKDANGITHIEDSTILLTTWDNYQGLVQLLVEAKVAGYLVKEASVAYEIDGKMWFIDTTHPGGKIGKESGYGYLSNNRPS